MRLPGRLTPPIAVSLALALAQTSPRFDVASVKAAHGNPIGIKSDPGRITVSSVALDVLIRLAFGLREYQYQGPAWLHVTRYDIAGTTAAPTTRSLQFEMLRPLLIERFHLEMRHETRNLPVYHLVISKGGARLRSMDASLPVPFDLYSNIGIEAVPGGASQFRATGSLALLCDFLGRIAGRPVLDATGLTGTFDFKLLCAIEGYPGEETSPTVFDAVQAQLGLKLEPRTDPIDVTVITRAEKPTDN